MSIFVCRNVYNLFLFQMCAGILSNSNILIQRKASVQHFLHPQKVVFLLVLSNNQSSLSRMIQRAISPEYFPTVQHDYWLALHHQRSKMSPETKSINEIQ